MRKSLNDAAYKGLDYVPYCSTMPVQAACDAPKFAWVRGGVGGWGWRGGAGRYADARHNPSHLPRTPQKKKAAPH